MRSPSPLLLSLASLNWVLAQHQSPLSPNLLDHSEQPTSHAPSYRESLLSLHKSLISIPSVSGTEGDVGKFLVDYLTDRGYTATIQFIAPRDNTPEDEQRYNVVAWPAQESDPENASGVRVDFAPDPKLLVSSHIDVVPPHIPYGIDDGEVTKDTVITGRGSVDAKGSVAAMITALEELIAKDSIAPEDVMLLFVVGEEVSGDGMKVFSDSLKDMRHPPSFKAAIFGEPTESKLACGHKGGLFCEISAQGIPGHSGYPWLGKSAIEVMVRALAKIIDTDLGSSEQYGNTTVNFGRLDGGVAANVIPEKATCNFAARVAIGPEEEGGTIVEKRVRKILDEVDDEAFEMTCSHGYGFVAADCDVDGFDSIVVNYGTDIPNLEGDHTRYLYGPGTILVAHGDHENITVGDLELAVEGYQRLMLHALTGETKPLSVQDSQLMSDL